ncbi:formin-binding protein 4 [Lingula anatina]|uniref:Formin-binding protein 4 n=1 Tax=Lingula anatina TaxID=7574 RepID=A0A1S3J721_LINAN|nr:formin-binding protein 4 [Lingula anatina]|eukprot:XP_013406212.1 formin-binding protein 4 [Lingula anatina]
MGRKDNRERMKSGPKSKGANPLSGLLGQYMDSDEEDNSDGSDSEGASSGKASNGQVKVIDSEVANFFAEIDAISQPPPPPPPDEEEEVPKHPQGPKLMTFHKGGELDESVQQQPHVEVKKEENVPFVSEEPTTLWQHCYDDNTQHYYYWHTVTNEVQWEMPAEYEQYLILLKQHQEALIFRQAMGLDSALEIKQEIVPGMGGDNNQTEKGGSNQSVGSKHGMVANEQHFPGHNSAQATDMKRSGKPAHGNGLDGVEMGENEEDEEEKIESLGEYPPPGESPQSSDDQYLKFKEEIGELAGAVGPEMPSEVDIVEGPQLPDTGEVKFQGPQSPDQTETVYEGPQLPDQMGVVYEGPQLPDQIGVVFEGPQLPSYYKKDVSSSGSNGDENEVSSALTDGLRDDGIQDQSAKEGQRDDSSSQVEDPMETDPEDSHKSVEAPVFTHFEFYNKKYEDSSAVDSTEEHDLPLFLHGFQSTGVTEPSSSQKSVDIENSDEDSIEEELEKALEKKKAELKLLDEGDLSNSSTQSRKREADDEVEDRTDFKKVKKLKPSKEEVRAKAEIVELTNLITSKLDFLDISTKGLSKLQILLVQIETRFQDWRDGALDTLHLLEKLKEADVQLKQFEESAAPQGWTCHWDRTYRRYFYMNGTTGESQWEYPDVSKDQKPVETPSELPSSTEVDDNDTEEEESLHPEKSQVFEVSSSSTRFQDWRDGALDTLHLLEKLKEADVQLKQFEESAAPQGWTCHWDRTYRRYFYMNGTTGESQWEYPDVSKDQKPVETPSELPSSTEVDDNDTEEEESLHPEKSQVFEVSSSSAEQIDSAPYPAGVGSALARLRATYDVSQVDGDEDKMDSSTNPEALPPLSSGTEDPSPPSFYTSAPPPPPPDQSDAQPPPPPPSSSPPPPPPLSSSPPPPPPPPASSSPPPPPPSGSNNPPPPPPPEGSYTPPPPPLSNSSYPQLYSSGAPPPPPSVLLPPPPPPPPESSGTVDMDVDTDSQDVDQLYEPDHPTSSDYDNFYQTMTTQDNKAGVMADSGLVTGSTGTDSNGSVIIARPPQPTNPPGVIANQSQIFQATTMSGEAWNTQYTSGQFNALSQPSVGKSVQASAPQTVLTSAETPQEIQHSNTATSSSATHKHGKGEKKKKKKDKGLLPTGLSMKKKNVSSMVQKWQNVQKEVEIQAAKEAQEEERKKRDALLYSERRSEEIRLEDVKQKY